MRNRITLITVCYNGAASIRDTLESVANQSCQNFEHVIVDGASTDGTVDIIRNWTRHAVRLVSEPDEGIFHAMNKGLQLATGDVIGFLNADDVFADSSVLSQVEDVFEDQTVESCYADLMYVSNDHQRVVRFWKSASFKKGAFARGWCPAHPTFFVRRSVVKRLGGFDPSFGLAADAELMMRYLERGGISSRYVSRVWVRMRVGGQSNRLRSIHRQNREILRALRVHGVPVSLVAFVLRKTSSRVGQLGMGLAKSVRRYMRVKSAF